MSHPIISRLSTLLGSYRAFNATVASLALSLETRTQFRASRLIKEKNWSPQAASSLSSQIVLFKNYQIVPLLMKISWSKEWSWDEFIVRIGGSVVLNGILSESACPRITQNRSYHRIVSGMGIIANITVKAANIFAVSVLLRKYSQGVMVVGGVAMTILSTVSLWYDWKNGYYFHGDQSRLFKKAAEEKQE